MKKRTPFFFIITAIVLCLVYCAFILAAFPALASCKTAATSAQAAVLMERDSGRVLFSKNQDAKLPMASCTKILTAITVLQNCAADEAVTVSKKAVGIEGSSIYLREGEQLTVIELLYGLMLRSGNDAAVALAIHAAGSVKDFADLMNETAKEIGANNSNFINPHGLHDENHYTTAYDLALITCHALKNPLFQKIVATKKITVGKGEQARYFINKNKLLSMSPNASGVKTGFTKRAGRCFVGSAQNDEGMTLVAVVLNCGPMFEDSLSLLNYGFKNFQNKRLVMQNKICSAQLSRNRATYQVCQKAITYPLKRDGSEDSLIKKTITREKEGYILSIYLDKQLLFSQKLVTIYGNVN